MFMDISYSKRSLINCGVDFFSLLLWFSLEHHTFPKIPQHQKKNIRNDYIDKKLRDPLSISRSKTRSAFFAVV